MTDDTALVVIGGCGHVGLPLAIVAAHAGQRTVICDVDGRAVDRVLSGEMPFFEEGAEPMLREVLASGRLTATTDPAAVSAAGTIVLVIGTPIDEHLTPRMTVI